MRRLTLAVLAITTTGLAGCAAYHPKPINDSEVNRALIPPDPEEVRVQAQSLVHPILPPMAVNMDDGLSPDEAAVIAVLVSPSLRAVRDKRGLAEAQLLQAGMLPNPQFVSSLDTPVGATTQGTMVAYSVGLSWDFQDLIGRSATEKAAKATQASVALDVAWQEWQTAQAARLAVYSLLSLEKQADLSQEMERRLAKNLSLVRDAVDKGLKTELDLAAAQSASDQARVNLLDMRKRVRQQRLALNRSLGLPADKEVRPQAGICLPPNLAVPSQADLLAGLEQRRLDLVALRRGYESQEATLRAAVLAQFPKINIGVNSARDTSNVNTIGVPVTIDLPIFDRNQGVIAKERATRQQLFDEYVNRIFEARSDIAKLLDDIAIIAEQIRANQDAEPGLERLVDTYQKAVDRGQADVLSYYTAWNDLTSKRQEILVLEQQLVEAGIALEIAAGLYRLETPEGPPGATRPMKHEVTK